MLISCSKEGKRSLLELGEELVRDLHTKVSREINRQARDKKRRNLRLYSPRKAQIGPKKNPANQHGISGREEGKEGAPRNRESDSRTKPPFHRPPFHSDNPPSSTSREPDRAQIVSNR